MVVDNETLVRDQLTKLRDPRALERSIDEIDHDIKRNRIYIMGCGRSGTWLLTSFFSTYADMTIVPKELPVQYFGMMTSQTKNLLFKRDFQSYTHVELIPSNIKIIWIVRHPFDVLTSHNPNTKNDYHVQPHRFLGEMLALRYLVETNKAAHVIKYEDLVTDPYKAQENISNDLGLTIEASPDEIPKRFNSTERAKRSMHGIRKIDSNSISNYLNDSAKISYLKNIMPRIYPVLDWLTERYSYNFDIN